MAAPAEARAQGPSTVMSPTLASPAKTPAVEVATINTAMANKETIRFILDFILTFVVVGSVRRGDTVERALGASQALKFDRFSDDGGRRAGPPRTR
jgi:hypothetical protein